MNDTKEQAKIKITELVSLVENMLELHKKHRETRRECDKELYERLIKIIISRVTGGFLTCAGCSMKK